jgi:porphobilinogen synthase
MKIRPRRLRQNAHLRELVSEVDLSVSHLIQPYFLGSSPNAKDPIKGFSEVYRWGEDSLSKKIESDLDRGVKSFLLFGSSPESEKNERGSAAYAENGNTPRALRALKKRFGNSLLLFTDVCLCPFTSHGHCGVTDEKLVLNDESLEPLAQMALCHAEAGADFVAPSDMMDGRIGFIRSALDAQGFTSTGILSYTAKYSSAYYGPFREALGSSPKSEVSSALPRALPSDRSTYQMDFRNRTEALRELELDLNEGADMVMVKPALAYLDIIREFKEKSPVPVVAYSVSGEYEMVKALAGIGMADEQKLAIENLTAIKRAGADIIITYYTSTIAEKGWLQ